MKFTFVGGHTGPAVLGRLSAATLSAPFFSNRNGPYHQRPFNLKFPTYLSIYSENWATPLSGII